MFLFFKNVKENHWKDNVCYFEGKPFFSLLMLGFLRLNGHHAENNALLLPLSSSFLLSQDIMNRLLIIEPYFNFFKERASEALWNGKEGIKL